MNNGEESVTVICGNLRKCLELREKYIAASAQLCNPKDTWSLETIARAGRDLDAADIPPTCAAAFAIDEDGLFRDQTTGPNNQQQPDIPTVQQYYDDFEYISQLCSDGPTKSWAFRRLRLLSSHFHLHLLQAEQAERDAQKRVPHRDFYNVRKIDTHVHHSSAMNSKHLLRFIKAKLKQAAGDLVIFRDERELSLAEVFESLKLTAYDLSIDALDMHAHKDSFHRFDRFNLKYNPMGESRLREIFLKTDNMIKGRYLAEISKEVFEDLQASKYQMAEYRLSIYGRNKDEWSKLADWVANNRLYSDNVRWIIQFPRLYHIYRAANSLTSFQGFLQNIFEPLFLVTNDPQSNPRLYHFLLRVNGFDTVDDESRRERRIYKSIPKPLEWQSETNPPYSYYLYYLYANIAALNQFRERRQFSTLLLSHIDTFTFRPHSGEAGDPDHLVSAFLTSQGINHGVLLRKIPVMQYLYYLAKIPISMSPLSNNALFLSFDRNPFPDYFQRGLQVTLSTDDPLQFHYTREPLMEEYSVAAQIWKLSSCDMCEIARNSVLGSGWEAGLKERWIGSATFAPSSDSSASSASSVRSSPLSLTFDNDIAKTNVPDIRVNFRQQRHIYEMGVVYSETGASPPMLLLMSAADRVELSRGEQVMLREVEEEILETHDDGDHTARLSPAPSI